MESKAIAQEQLKPIMGLKLRETWGVIVGGVIWTSFLSKSSTFFFMATTFESSCSSCMLESPCGAFRWSQQPSLSWWFEKRFGQAIPATSILVIRYVWKLLWDLLRSLTAMRWERMTCASDMIAIESVMRDLGDGGYIIGRKVCFSDHGSENNWCMALNRGWL